MATDLNIIITVNSEDLFDNICFNLYIDPVGRNIKEQNIIIFFQNL